MATSNIQKTWIESEIYWISNDDFDSFYPEYETLEKEVENLSKSYEMYSKFYEQWVNIDLNVKVASCYYDWCNIYIELKSDMDTYEDLDEMYEDLWLSETNKDKIEKAIDGIEKAISKIALVKKLRCLGTASNGESFYEEVK